ncbi:MAG: hypothetical protein AAFN65_14910, partial [Bacteroidota bacterium]
MLYTHRAIKYRREQWKALVVLTLILVLSPPLWTRFGPQTVWVQEAFIPGGHIMSMDKDVLVTSGKPVQVYRRKESGWEQEAALMSKGGNTEGFGSNVEIDGDTIFITDATEPYEDENGKRFGRIYSSSYDGTQWSEPTRLPPFPPFDGLDRIGPMLAADGNILVNGNYGRAVHIYERENSSEPWQFKTTLI